MRIALFLLLLVSALAPAASAQPRILGLQNNYGFLPAGTQVDYVK